MLRDDETRANIVAMFVIRARKPRTYGPPAAAKDSKAGKAKQEKAARMLAC